MSSKKIVTADLVPFCIKALISGILIGIGGSLYIQIMDWVAAPFLFSVGLIAVVLFEVPLYTGRIGFIPYAPKTGVLDNVVRYALMLTFNLLGAALMGFLASSLYPSVDLSVLAAGKCGQSVLKAFVMGIGCGIMMYLAVLGYKKTNNLFMLMFPVAAFIYCKFDHCVADTFYFAFAHTMPTWYYLPAVILGNSLGSILVRFLTASDFLMKEKK